MKPKTNFKISVFYIILMSTFISECKIDSSGISFNKSLVGFIYFLISIVFLLVVTVQYYKSKSKL